MKYSKTLAAAVAAFLVTGAAHAQTAPASLEGRPVRGQDGSVLGYVERVILRSDGRPAQVLVRPKGPMSAGPRSLSFAALRVEGDGLTAPLTQAEFNAMPAVDVAPR